MQDNPSQSEGPGDQPSVGLGKRILGKLVRSKRLRRWLPRPVKNLILRRLPARVRRYATQVTRKYTDADNVSTYPPNVDVTMGIIKAAANFHEQYISACRDLQVPYRVIDISGPQWVDEVREAGCDAFLVNPVWRNTAAKEMDDERLRIMVEDLGALIYPTQKELWLHEKRRMCYWLQTSGLPHARTWVFYNEVDAMEFARSAELPIVVKLNTGYAAMGVRVIRRRGALRRYVRRCFGKGHMSGCLDDRFDRQRACVIFQQHIPNSREWRMIRIGESYFGYEKILSGDFHSGSGRWAYDRPPTELLDLLKQLTDKGRFTSMDVDILVDEQGRPFVIELQAVFGMGKPWDMCQVDGKRGRMLHDPDSGAWRFEPGDFCRNFMCNLRLEVVLKMLGKDVPAESLWSSE